MCGRYTQLRAWSELVALYRITFPAAALNLPRRYNVAPTQAVPIVRQRGAERELVLVRWGLVPFWAKDLEIGNRMINARAETVGEKPAFRRAFRERRCLVLADGFYEWRPEPRRKQPYYITLPEGRPFAFAGLWERWQPPGQEEAIDSCAIIVCAATPALRPIHDRMPVILEPGACDAWLRDESEPAELAAMLKPFDSALQITPVGPRVGNVRNDDEDCLTPRDLFSGLSQR